MTPLLGTQGKNHCGSGGAAYSVKAVKYWNKLLASVVTDFVYIFKKDNIASKQKLYTFPQSSKAPVPHLHTTNLQSHLFISPNALFFKAVVD